MTGAELWAEQQGPLTIAAVVQNKTIIALEVDNSNVPVRAGTVLSARVSRVVPKLKMAEVDLGPLGPAFLADGRVKMGDVIQVEWLCPAYKDKLQTVRRTEKPAGEGPGAIMRALVHQPARARVNTPGLQKQLGALGLSSELLPQPFELIDLHSQIASFTSREVPLPSGGRLVFDRTEAFHVVDVDGGSQGEAANREAMLELARQLRLRNLGGAILVDAIGQRTPHVLDWLRQATGTDAHVLGMTRLGLLELTRPRRGYELARLLKHI